MAIFKDLTGQRFGRLVVTGLKHKIHVGNRFRYYWQCICDCGNECKVRTDCLTSGNTQSCGCLHKEQAIKNVSKHHSHCQSHTRLYGIWQKMKDRCINPNTPCYSRYGGRGIKLCAEWTDDFSSFYHWAITHGYSDTLSIDRINNNGNYEPCNCRWITFKEQCRNRRTNIIVDYQNEQMTLVEASELSGIPYSTLYARWHNGHRGERLYRKVEKVPDRIEVTYKNKNISLTELSLLTGINLNTLRSRYRRGKRGTELIEKICQHRGNYSDYERLNSTVERRS